MASTLRAASGSGSKSRTSTPLRTNRAAQPPPITPPPSTATLRGRAAARSAMAPQPQLFAHIVGTQHPRVHRLEDRHRALDQLTVGREHATREIDVVLEADSHVAARER